MKVDGTFDSLSKRERLQISRTREKLEINLGSIVKMNRMPEAIFIIDINKEHIALKESTKLGIRSFALTDTNTNPAHVFSVNGNTFFGANVTINNTLLDGDNRAFKVYYANGDVAWG